MRNSLHIVAVYSREGKKTVLFPDRVFVTFVIPLYYLVNSTPRFLSRWASILDVKLRTLISVFSSTPPPPLRPFSQLLSIAYHSYSGLPGFPAFLFGLKRVSVLFLFNTFDLFSLLEEFNRLCPGGIGFVPDPYTLVIKGMSVLFSLVSSLIKHLEKS